ncbi:glycoside hydrolase family 3 N-terminal domain-containing protein [Novosphingobium sp.]|uniref:glycoside hydrolase family 3 N-terminal domain-containing protein n=1 Tax=Novosphingobium sp. TaxID=1874826 RepID=UPI0033428BFE
MRDNRVPQGRISRRGALIGMALSSAWLASPARALTNAAERTAIPGFIDDLIARMTIEEKAGQLTLMASAWGGSSATALNPPGTGSSFTSQINDAVAGKLTGVFNGNGAGMALQMQTAVMARSRLKIPLIFAADIIHGHRTIFPIPMGEAASFEPDLATRTARVAAFEAAGSGIDWTFAPMVDIARDQRWGRTMEGAGEDVLLGRLFAAARVRGFQGHDLTADDAMMACAKHFAAYGAAEAGLDYSTVDVSERTLREVYFPPFQAAFDAGCGSTMASFNEISGVPATANHWLLTDVLRDEWHYAGLVVSDYTGDEELIAHGVAADGRDAARLAIMAGVDMSMQSNLYFLHLPGLVRDGLVPLARVDQAVRRVLATKAMLGLFDNPFRRIDPARETRRSLLPASRALAREAATKSIVLLKNDGALLPLNKSANIALIGPFGSGPHDIIGGWNVYGDDRLAVDLATGLRQAGGSVTVVRGCDVEAAIVGGIEQAVAAARAADVVILTLGESQDMSGEAQARAEIGVPAAQLALAEAINATGKPVVVLLSNGRGLALQDGVRAAPAIMVTWFLGTEGGNAIADVIYGAVSPSGRLPVSFPYATGQEPYHYDHKATGRPQPDGALQPYKAHYRGLPDMALFPFGHGLTYGDVRYTDLHITATTLAPGASVTIAITLTNHGKHAVAEVAQLYTRTRTASISRPVRELRGFQKVPLSPGEARTVHFTLAQADMRFIGLRNTPVVEPGLVDVWVAPSAQAEGLRGQITLTA